MTLEVIQFRKAGDKWKPVRLGYAKKNDKGQLNVYLDALPLPDEKGCSFVIQEQRERPPQQQRQQPPMDGRVDMPPGFDDALDF